MKKKNNSNKVFGLFFSIFFFLLSSFSFFFLKSQISYSFFFIAIIFLLLVLVNSIILTPLNRMWIHFGMFLGKITAPILMAIIYLFALIPISFYLKILNKNYLNIKQDIKLDTYWEENDKLHKNMNDQF